MTGDMNDVRPGSDGLGIEVIFEKKSSKLRSDVGRNGLIF